MSRDCLSDASILSAMLLIIFHIVDAYIIFDSSYAKYLTSAILHCWTNEAPYLFSRMQLWATILNGEAIFQPIKATELLSGEFWYFIIADDPIWEVWIRGWDPC